PPSQARTPRKGDDDRVRTRLHLRRPAPRSRVILNVVVLGLVTLSRLVELPFAAANSRRLLAAGGHEVAPGHYPLIVALHAAWLTALWWLAPARPVNLPLLMLFGLVELARLWVLQTIGRRWTTRIIVVPYEKLVRRGPYRNLDQPYCAE